MSLDRRLSLAMTPVGKTITVRRWKRVARIKVAAILINHVLMGTLLS